MKWNKSVIIGIIFILLIPSINISVSSQGNISWWDKNWSSRQEIIVPIDTSLEMAKYQPVDIRVTFNDPCWAKNTDEHSVRVCYSDGKTWYELESQIYDLDKSDDTHIKACSLVFLIPKEATGKESYYVYYDDSEKPKVNYPDHVILAKEHYYYEPIPGQKVDIDYYKITDEGFCVYGVGIQGMMLTEYSSQMIFRQSKGQKDFSYKYWDRLGTFCFQYVDKSLPVGQDTITTRMKLISSEIFVEGNLMAQFGIVSTTSREDAKTTDIYKYYYSPVDVKRICVNVKHEILKDIGVAGEEKVDGEYAFTSGFKTRSEANAFLNTGEILPHIHYYNKDDTVKDIQADTDPKSRDEEWLVSVEDNADLGSYPWVSADSGETGKAHALIFSSNKVVKSGKDEQDGIQLKASQKQEVDIPGLKAYSSGIGCFRNAYSPGGSPDRSIPSDLRVEFDGEFFTTEINSYKDVENEAVLFQSLVKNRPLLGGNISGGEKEGEKYNLTVYTHFAPSFPLGSLISAASGKNFSYTYAELYKDGNLVSSGICSRVSLAGELNLEKITLSGILKLFDWKSVSLFKKIRFPELSPGEYVVKIYIRVKNENKFVGVKIIDLKEDTKTHILCHKQGKIKVTVNDQNGKSIPDAECHLLLQNTSIAKITINDKGENLISAPRGKYELKIMYKGFTLYRKQVKIGILEKKVNFETILSNLNLLVSDKLGLAPGIKITPYLTSDEMEIQTKIQSEEEKPGVYCFSNLPSAKYKIQIDFKTSLDEKEVQIPGDGDTVSMVFSPTFQLSTNVFDVRGNPLADTKIIIKREGKTLQSVTDGTGLVTFNVPGGVYTVEAYDDKNVVIAEKQVEISRDETSYLVTTQEPIYPMIMMIASILLIIMGAILILLKKISLKSFLKILSIAIIITALVLPWWQLYGSGQSIERTTNTYLIPQTMVTTTVFKNVQESELANIPAEFTIFLFAITIIAAVSCVPIIGSILLRKHRKIANILTFLGMFLLILSCAIFSYGFGELTKVGLGSLQGSGTLEILPSNSQEYVKIPASWGLSYGIFFTIAAIILLGIAFFYEFKQRRAMIKK
ncbi:MAG: hypothetical protein NTV74_03905 [Euryarchaeota archaeon]|nr:hypothetical protein [Euryarchaeota archaeon]